MWYRRAIVWFTIPIAIATAAAAPANAGISVELAKKCRAMMVKAHPSILFGRTGTAAAQRAYFEECVRRNGYMPEAEQNNTRTPPK